MRYAYAVHPARVSQVMWDSSCGPTPEGARQETGVYPLKLSDVPRMEGDARDRPGDNTPRVKDSDVPELAAEYPRLIVDTTALCIEIVMSLVFIVGLHRSKELDHVDHQGDVVVINHVHGAPEDEQQQQNHHLHRHPDNPWPY
ncbi:unnamed protein product [Diatraea saccharalis]|uniref:Uncharacterized protein n=1 Tax=Diatraea saccharalis TaxID=40085 RepID=A0A9N9R392_9NEOP|nr:unnamed protein product [Diatraea saccharalis]